MELVAIIGFALAVSADGFGAGVAYGIRNIRIPLVSLMVICLASFSAVGVSMLLGQSVACYLSPNVAGTVGALILIIMGLWLVLEALKSSRLFENQEDNTIVSLRIRPLGIIIQILKEPARADFDCSGEISAREAFFLGLALAMDALAAGMAVAMAGYNVLATALTVGIAKFLLVSAGLAVGKFANNGFLKKISTIVSGLILLSLGVIEIL